MPKKWDWCLGGWGVVGSGWEKSHICDDVLRVEGVKAMTNAEFKIKVQFNFLSFFLSFLCFLFTIIFYFI